MSANTPDANTLEKYLELNYPYELVRDCHHGGYFAEHLELPGCATQGETADEAIENLNSARELWIEARIQDGLPVPTPPTGDFSGRFSLRIPPTLHERLGRIANQQKISLNLLLNTILSNHVGGATLIRELHDHLEDLRPGLMEASNRKVDHKAHRVTIRAAAFAFRKGNRALADELLKSLPEGPETKFLLGLLCLEKPSNERYEEGITYCSWAYEDGLTDEEASQMFFALPQAPSLERLKEILFLPAFTSRAENMEPAFCKLVAWMEEEQNNHARAEEWLKRAMEDIRAD